MKWVLSCFIFVWQCYKHMKLKQCPSQTFSDEFLLELLQGAAEGGRLGHSCRAEVHKAKKGFDLSQVLGQWHPEEHQGDTEGRNNLIRQPQLTCKYGSGPWTQLKVQPNTPSLHFLSETQQRDTKRWGHPRRWQHLLSPSPRAQPCTLLPTVLRHLVLRSKHMAAKSFSFCSFLPPPVLLLSIFLTLTPQI